VPDQPRRRWPRRLAVVLLVLVALVAGGLTVALLRLPQDSVQPVSPGTLTLGQDVPARTVVGTVAVEVAPGDEPGVTIRRGGDVVWASDPGSAFVTASDGSIAWEEHRGYFWPTVTRDAVLAEQQLDVIRREGRRIVLEGSLAGDADGTWSAVIAPRADGGVVLALDATVDGAPASAVQLVSGRTPDAPVHGFGETYAAFDLSGRVLPLVIREQGVGRGEQPVTLLADLTTRGAGGDDTLSYASMATFVTGDLRGVRLTPELAASHAVGVADTTNSGQVRLESWAPTMTAELTAADTPAALVATQEGTVQRPALADWVADGAVVGLQGGTEKVRQEVADLLDAGAAIEAVWLQDWTGRRTTSFGDRLWWTWQLDAERYPGWDDLVADLAAEGIRTTTYVNTWLVDAAPKGDPSIRNLWQEAANRGFLVERADGSPYLQDQGDFDASLVDLTDRRARAWYARVIAEEVLGLGVDGFMADFGEALPFDGVIAAGSPLEQHNRWPLLWAQTVRRACVLAEKPDCVAFFRAGSLGQSAAAPVYWAGDQLVTFGPEDGLASALLGTFHAGLSGWHAVHSDVGGYTSVNTYVRNYVRQPDLNQRWAEFQVFGPMLRTHETNRPAVNAQVYDDADAEAAFARATRLYAALADYRRDVVAEAVATGIPVVRHGWLEAPGTAAAAVDTQFFFGPSILVAPVLRSGTEDVTVTFPPGTWVHLLTGEEFPGDQTLTVAAPLGEPAAFVRADDPRRAALEAAVAAAGAGTDGR
jgi:alpha-glucosidase